MRSAADASLAHAPAALQPAPAVDAVRSPRRRAAVIWLLYALVGCATVVAATIRVPVDPRLSILGTSPAGVVGGLLFFTGLTLLASWGSAIASSGLVVSMSGAAVTASLLLGGPAAAVWVALVGTTEPRELRGDVPLGRVIQNHLVIAMAAALGGTAAVFLRPTALAVSGDPIVADLVAFSVGASVFWVMNVALVVPLVALRFERPMHEIVHDMWPAELSAQLVMSAVGFLMAETYLHMAWWLTPLCLVPLVSVRFSVERDRATWLAGHDQLTGLTSRRAFDRQLEALSRGAPSGKRAAGLLIVDLDRFKAINDTYGHAAGDAVLREVATRLSATVRRTDTVARLGGDEFGVIVRGVVDETALQRRAEAIVASVREPIVVGSLTLSVGASVGGVRVLDPSAPSDDLFSRADQAMYRAKQANAGALIDAPVAAVPFDAASVREHTAVAAAASHADQRRPIIGIAVFAALFALLVTTAVWIYLGPRPATLTYYTVSVPNVPIDTGHELRRTPDAYLVSVVTDNGSGQSVIPPAQVLNRVEMGYQGLKLPASTPVTGPYQEASWVLPSADQLGDAERAGLLAGVVAFALLLLIDLPRRAGCVASWLQRLARRLWRSVGTTRRAKAGSVLLFLIGVTWASLLINGGEAALFDLAALAFPQATPYSAPPVTHFSMLPQTEQLIVSTVAGVAIWSLPPAAGMAVTALVVRIQHFKRGVGPFLFGFGFSAALSMIGQMAVDATSCTAMTNTWVTGMVFSGTFGGSEYPGSGALACIASTGLDPYDERLAVVCAVMVLGALLIYRRWHVQATLRTQLSGEILPSD